VKKRVFTIFGIAIAFLFIGNVKANEKYQYNVLSHEIILNKLNDSEEIEITKLANDTDTTGTTTEPSNSGESSCGSLLGDPKDPDKEDLAYWLQWILNAMKYIAIAALLVLSTLDFIKAMVGNDKDALKKAGTTVAKRFVFCVILFFLPIIVEMLMSFIGAYGTCGLG
jgi:hypothetical protein